jgi:hypothetical protein
MLWMLASTTVMSQGVIPRKVQPTGRVPHSGLPFGASFTDVAQQAGLKHPVIYGGLKR